MQAIWEPIEAWLAVHAADLLDTLRPGATAAEIEEAENFLGVSLPEDVKTSYRIHDGQWAAEDKADLQQWKDYGLYNMHQLLSLARMKNNWRVWQDVNENLEPKYKWVTLESGKTIATWSDKFIPLSSDGCGDAYFLDLSALLMGGNVGQIIEYHDCDGLYMTAPSFRAWLETFAADLEAGQYWYDIEFGWLLDLRIFPYDS